MELPENVAVTAQLSSPKLKQIDKTQEQLIRFQQTKPGFTQANPCDGMRGAPAVLPGTAGASPRL